MESEAQSQEQTLLPKPLKRQHKRRRPFKLGHFPGLCIVLVVVGLTALFLAVSIPLSIRWLQLDDPSGRFFPNMISWVCQERIVEILLLWWVVAFSASIGSFLNVVVYRMPLGKSLSAKGSHCVWCNTKIRSQDNIPIVGWLLLRGRCFKCRLPISGRYPLVETLTATCGLILFMMTVQINGLGLPQVIPYRGNWHFWLMNASPAASIVLYFYFVVLMSTLMAIAWINYDQNRVPVRLIAWVAGAGLLLPLTYKLWLGPYIDKNLETNIWNRFSFLTPSTRSLASTFDYLLVSIPSENLRDALTTLMGQFLSLAIALVCGILVFGFLKAFMALMLDNANRDGSDTLAQPTGEDLPKSMFSQLSKNIEPIEGDAAPKTGTPAVDPKDADAIGTSNQHLLGMAVETTQKHEEPAAQVENQINPQTESSPGKVSLWECMAIFGLIGVYCGHWFCVSQILIFPTLLLVANSLCGKSSIRPTRCQWFLLPYSFLITVAIARLLP